QLFGDGLGYKLKTLSPTAFQLEHKMPVKGVGTADAALGDFPQAGPSAVIELKGAKVDLDRDKSNGRTAVQQCWDYLNALPGCPWGIVSNFSTIRSEERRVGKECRFRLWLLHFRKHMLIVKSGVNYTSIGIMSCNTLSSI